MNMNRELEKEIVERQEVASVDILFQQNRLAAFVQILYAAPYCYESWGTTSHAWLISWASIYLSLALIRTVASSIWKNKMGRGVSVEQARKWLFAFQVLLFLSGVCWMPIAWNFAHGSAMQQILAAMPLIFIAGGSISLYASSLSSIYLIVIPPYVTWIVAMMIAPSPVLHLAGTTAAIYLMIGMKVAHTLSRYMQDALRLTMVHAHAEEELLESNEKLNMALKSSGALTWSWNLKTKIARCEGDLSMFGVSSGWVEGTEAEYLTLVNPAERIGIRDRILAMVDPQDSIETEHHIQIPGGGEVFLAIRGKAYRDESGEIVACRGICWDATGKRNEEELRRERDVQEAANKAKSMFLANASHEMRTPLAAISGYTEALLDADLPTQIRKDLLVVQRTGRYLTSLVNDFLDLSRIETGQLYVQKNMIAPEKEITDVLQIVQPTFDSKNLKLTLEVATLLPAKIESDQTRLRQILINMLSNAAKYTQSGEVRVRVTYDLKSDGKALLCVRVIDTGVGMAESIKQNLFRPFARGETAFIKRTEGAGLGMALSRSLARALGGDLQLIRSFPNQGSEFEFSLMLDAVQAVGATVVRPSKDPVLKAVPPQLPLDKLRILVAEDSEDLRELMERVLQSKGALVTSCGDGAQAVRLALEDPYDLILMDINMPVMDGYQATASLRAKGYSAPVIALTAHASIEHRQLSREAGCDAYLSKPINANGLVDVLKDLVTSARLAERQRPQADAQV